MTPTHKFALSMTAFVALACVTFLAVALAAQDRRQMREQEIHMLRIDAACHGPARDAVACALVFAR